MKRHAPYLYLALPPPPAPSDAPAPEAPARGLDVDFAVAVVSDDEDTFLVDFSIEKPETQDRGIPVHESLKTKMRNDGFISVKDAAKQASIPMSTMYDWAMRKFVTSVKIGGARFINQASLTHHLKGRR
jgi:hypothetical protein